MQEVPNYEFFNIVHSNSIYIPRYYLMQNMFLFLLCEGTSCVFGDYSLDFRALLLPLGSNLPTAQWTQYQGYSMLDQVAKTAADI